MTSARRHSTTCHVCNAQVFVHELDSDVTAVMTVVVPVPPARDCAVCRDVSCRKLFGS